MILTILRSLSLNDCTDIVSFTPLTSTRNLLKLEEILIDSLTCLTIIFNLTSPSDSSKDSFTCLTILLNLSLKD